MLIFEKDLLPHKVDYMDIFNYICIIGNNINSNYIYGLMCEETNKIVLYSIDNDWVDIKSCPCALIYSLQKDNSDLYVCIQFVATKYSCRKVGYASLFLREFIGYIKEKYETVHKGQIKLLLDSVMESVTFYENIGFRWVIDVEYKDLLDIPENDEVEHFIMVYDIVR
jgi:hypothetical protein